MNPKENPQFNPIPKIKQVPEKENLESKEGISDKQLENIKEVFKLSPELEVIAFDGLGIENDKDIVIDLGRNKDEASLGKIQNINVYYKGELILNSDDKSQSKKLILVTQKDGTSFVGDILLPEELQGKGLGVKILKKVSNELNTRIVPSHTVGSHHTSPPALRMWEKVGNEIVPNHEGEKLYAEYLKTIFSESKVQDIVWHGTPEDLKFDKFVSISKGVFGEEIKNAPVYFTNSIFYAKGFAENEKQYKKIENGIPSVVPALINIKEFTSFNKPITHNGNPSFRFAIEYNKEDLEWTVYTASPDDIHILGSKVDIEKFKEFVSKNKTGKETTSINPDSKIIELANKYNKGDEIPVNFEKVEGTAGIFKIVLDGERIGKFTLFDPSSVGRKSDVKVKQIGYINIDDAFRGKGLGKQFYINLNSYLNAQDETILESGDDTTMFADHVWESLYKDGLVEKKESTVNGKDCYQFKKII